MYEINIIFSLVAMLIAASWYCYFDNKKIKIWYLLIAALISYPWQIGDNVYSLFGGKNTRGSVYSLVGIYQEAKNDAVALIGCGYQNAGQDVGQLAGLAIYQNSRKSVAQGLGVALYQNAGQDVGQLAGLAIHQNAGQDILQGLGVSFYQNAGKNTTTGIGMAFYQNAANNAVVGLGIPMFQKAGNYAGVSWKLAFKK